MEKLRECTLPTSRATLRESLQSFVGAAFKWVGSLSVSLYDVEVARVIREAKRRGVQPQTTPVGEDDQSMLPGERVVREAIMENQLETTAENPRAENAQQRIDQYFEDSVKTRG